MSRSSSGEAREFSEQCWRSNRWHRSHRRQAPSRSERPSGHRLPPALPQESHGSHYGHRAPLRRARARADPRQVSVRALGSRDAQGDADRASPEVHEEHPLPAHPVARGPGTAALRSRGVAASARDHAAGVQTRSHRQLRALDGGAHRPVPRPLAAVTPIAARSSTSNPNSTGSRNCCRAVTC